MRKWKVVSISTNTNSFGLYGFIFVSDRGDVYECGGNSLKRRDMPKGHVLEEKSNAGNPTYPMDGFDANQFFILQGFEIPKRLAVTVPPDELKSIWT